MLNSNALDVAIGIVVLYLLVSLICSAVTEGISRLLNLRAKFLVMGIGQMLGDTAMASSGNPSSGNADSQGKWLAQAVVRHPAISKLKEPRGDGIVDKLYVAFSWIVRAKDRVGMPSYIPARTFAVSLVESLAQGPEGNEHVPITQVPVQARIDGLKDDDATSVIPTLWRQADADLAKFQKAIEQWFDDSMARVTGWYKRYVRWFVLSTAVVVVVALNADTLTVGLTLWQDQTVRDEVVAIAAKAVNATPQGAVTPAATPLAQATPGVNPSQPLTGIPDTAKAQQTMISDLRSGLSDMKLLGWTGSTGEKKDPRERPSSWDGWLYKIGGLLITIVAVQMGANFWFDALKKLINVRSAGDRPAASAESAG